MSDDYETHELELAFQAGAASRDAYIERLETGLLQVRKALCGDIHNTDDLLDLIARRDAEIQRLQFALADSEALELGTAERCDQLRAQINALREALEEIGDTACGEASHQYIALTALASTPEQSLAEYRNKGIEAFVNEFSRHVGGDGEFWLHELQDFVMKEQP